MNYSPEPVGTAERMSVFNDSEPRDDKHYLTRQTNLSTSTPKTPLGQKTRASLSTVYRLSGTCSICLRQKADHELVSHDKCGNLFCYQCMQVGTLKKRPIQYNRLSMAFYLELRSYFVGDLKIAFYRNFFPFKHCFYNKNEGTPNNQEQTDPNPAITILETF